MSDEFQELCLTGGKLLLSNGSTKFTHAKPLPCAIIPIKVKISGWFSEDGGELQLGEWTQEVLLVSDIQGMFGSRCPYCVKYFRTSSLVAVKMCPYCGGRSHSSDFMTDSQKRYINAYTDELVASVSGGEREVDLDALIAGANSGASPFSYKETSQQTKFKCSQCSLKVDIFGLYGACPNCGERNTLDVFTGVMGRLEERVDNPRHPEHDRHLREAEWEEVIKSSVSAFEGLARDVIEQLIRIPTTDRRRRQLSELSLMNPVKIHQSLVAWSDIELLAGLSEDEIGFLVKFFARRHLFTHTSGIVDDEYLQATSDSSVIKGQKLRVRSKEAKRLVVLTRKLGQNLFNDYKLIK